MYDSEYDEVKKILDNNEVTDLDQIEYGSEVYEDLYDYFANSGEMPYGVMKARTGMPDEWIIDRVYDLGVLLDQDYYDANGLPLNFTNRYHQEEEA
jgi:hypothetical protein